MKPRSATPGAAGSFGFTGFSGLLGVPGIRGVLALLGLLVVWAAWMALLLTTVVDPPVDNIEQLTWVRSLQWGYHKHPPLPTWLIWPAVAVFGLQPWVAALLGGVVQLLALMLWWDLLRRMAGRTVAWMSLVAALCLVFHSARLHHYNHNVVMLLASVAAAWCLWRAWTQGQLRWWLALGLAFGLGLLTKYQMAAIVLAAIAFVAWGLRDVAPPGRATVLRGLLLSLVVAAAVMVPHVLWLTTHPENPLTYAADSTLGAGLDAWQRWKTWILWLADAALLKSAGALLLLGALALWTRYAAPAAPGVACPDSTACRGPDPGPADLSAARRLLACWLLIPLALISAMVLMGGSTIRPHWATTLCLWAIPLGLLWIGPRRLQRLAWPGVLTLAGIVQALLVAQHLRTEGQEARSERMARWGQPMAQRWAPAVAEAARLELRGDIRLVIGPQTIASAFALAVPDRPYVLLDGRADISPWVPPGLMHRCGVLFVAYEPPGPNAHPIEGGPEGIIWRAVPAADGVGCQGDEKRQPPPGPDRRQGHSP